MPGIVCSVCIYYPLSPNWRGDTLSIPGLELRKLQLSGWSGSCVPRSPSGRSSQDLSPALSASRARCFDCLLPLGQLLPKQRWPLGDAFLHLEPLSSHDLCLKQFQNLGAVSGVCSPGRTLQPPPVPHQACFLDLVRCKDP